MRVTTLLLLVCCFATLPASSVSLAAVEPKTAVDSSSSNSGSPSETPAPAIFAGRVGREHLASPRMRPFSALGVGVKVGLGGIGGDLATPISHHANLRGGATYFTYSPNVSTHGFDIAGKVRVSTVDAHLDWLPWAGSFRISPGLTIYNGNRAKGAVLVSAGQSFDLNHESYTSLPTDPVVGTFELQLGHKVAPSLTVGFGNLIPRRPGKHWSVPFEIGAEYTSTPVVSLALTGTACGSDGCHKIASDPATHANVIAQQNIFQKDLSPLKVYPILSIGLGYKF